MNTDVRVLPARPDLEQYKKQAKELVKAWNRGDADALRRIEAFHPHPKKVAKPALAEAQLVIAREHLFESWPKFRKHIEAVQAEHSPVTDFERAADAVVAGDLATLESLLRRDSTLVRARSTRLHRATLLHYAGANGVEDYRQKSPVNAVAVTRLLLDAGAEVNATADMYRRDTTLDLVATSIHPAKAGVQIPLIDTLLAAGAVIDLFPDGNLINSCLANGRPEAASYLAKLGARLDLEGAAGVGRLDLIESLFDTATERSKGRGLMWACEYGQTAAVERLLARGMDPGLQVDGMMGLHWAILGGHLDTVKTMLAHGAPLEVRNVYGGTALGGTMWSIANSDEVYRWPDTGPADWVGIVRALLESGARMDAVTYPTGHARIDEVFRKALAQVSNSA